MELLILPKGKGTELRKNRSNAFRLEIKPLSPINRRKLDEVLMILGDLLVPINHLGIATVEGIAITIQPHQEYMIMNTSEVDISIEMPETFQDDSILYNPYLFEEEIHQDINPELLISEFNVDAGYSDILAKWYSVKFTYADYNLIFVRPGIGISLQTHTRREEYWEIKHGKPIVIAGSKVVYACDDGAKFQIPLGNMHTIINPNETEWVILKEKYVGVFDEKDIMRIFNPNNYQ